MVFRALDLSRIMVFRAFGSVEDLSRIMVFRALGSVRARVRFQHARRGKTSCMPGDTNGPLQGNLPTPHTTLVPMMSA